MASGLITLWQIDGETMETVMEFLFLGSKITVDSDSSHEIRRCLPLGRKAVANLDSILKSKDITLLTKACIVIAMFFPVVMFLMWELKHKEGWVPKTWCFWTVVLEKTLDSTLDSKEIKPVNPKENQPWIFIGRTDVEATILWIPDANSRLTGKDSDAGKVWGQEKGVTENYMLGWHHWFNGREFEQTPGESEGQGSLLCCSPWGHKK